MTNNITVLFFANLKTAAQRDRIDLKIPAETRIRELRSILVDEIPDIEEALSTALAAINKNFATDDAKIPDEAEVAFFPPVRGGN
jgi:molybdopterin converting factor subunit 1